MAPVALHNLYHRNGMLAMAQGACWLVLAGVELARQKKEAGRGNWEQWVEENCEFNIRTAQRYMALAEGVRSRALGKYLGKTTVVSFLELLEKPPGSLSPEQQIMLLKSVHKLTDGETVQELYLDFGIISKAKMLGGKQESTKEKLTPEEQQAQWEKAAREDFIALANGLQEIGEKWKVPTVTEAELEHAAELAEQSAAQIRAWLRLPKSKRTRADLAAIYAVTEEPKI
jgi:hypothetical protein